MRKERTPHRGKSTLLLSGLFPYRAKDGTPGLPRVLPWAMSSLAFQAVFVTIETSVIMHYELCIKKISYYALCIMNYALKSFL